MQNRLVQSSTFKNYASMPSHFEQNTLSAACHDGDLNTHCHSAYDPSSQSDAYNLQADGLGRNCGQYTAGTSVGIDPSAAQCEAYTLHATGIAAGHITWGGTVVELSTPPGCYVNTDTNTVYYNSGGTGGCGGVGSVGGGGDTTVISDTVVPQQCVCIIPGSVTPPVDYQAADNWIMFDIGASLPVGFVRIYNGMLPATEERAQYDGRLGSHEIIVGDYPNDPTNPAHTRCPQTFACNSVTCSLADRAAQNPINEECVGTGRYVYIYVEARSGNYLHFREVEVYAANTAATLQTQADNANLPINTPTYTISVDAMCTAEQAPGYTGVTRTLWSYGLQGTNTMNMLQISHTHIIHSLGGDDNSFAISSIYDLCDGEFHNYVVTSSASARNLYMDGGLLATKPRRAPRPPPTRTSASVARTTPTLGVSTVRGLAPCLISRCTHRTTRRRWTACARCRWASWTTRTRTGHPGRCPRPPTRCSRMRNSRCGPRPAPPARASSSSRRTLPLATVAWPCTSHASARLRRRPPRRSTACRCPTRTCLVA